MAETPAVRTPQNDSREATNDLIAVLSQKVVGQPEAMSVIVPYLDMYLAELSPQGRPAGIFLLLGPTGTGKTRTVEALAEVLHGSAAKVLKINCGEFRWSTRWPN
jgi:ATP-dependent Clp protease ATP-binding subunit ClpA